MLKETPPQERQRELVQHHLKLNVYSGIAVLVWMFASDIGLGIERDIWRVVLLFIGFVLSMPLSLFMWHILVLWLGRVNTQRVLRHRSPGDDPRFVREFVESWWEHELVLSVFVVTFRLFITVAVFELLRPIAESLAGVS